MRRFIFLLLALVVAVWAGIKISQDPGYILLAYHHWTVEMPLWFGLICLLIFYWIMHSFWRIWHHVKAYPQRLKESRTQRLRNSANKVTQQGLQALAKGDWSTAKKKLFKAIKHTENPWLNYVTAGVAAHKLNAIEHREAYLNKAFHAESPQAILAGGLLKAHFYLREQPQEAIKVLKELQKIAPRQHLVLEYLARAYRNTLNWEELVNLLPTLEKNHVFRPEEFGRLSFVAYQGYLQTAQQTQDTKQIFKTWAKLPRTAQQHPLLQQQYIHILISKGANKEAQKQIIAWLDKSWNDKILPLYFAIPSAKPIDQLTIAEKWLTQHNNDGVLLLELGKMCVKQQLWGKARNYFEASMALNPSGEASMELARLYETMHEDKNKILINYKKALEFTLNQQAKSAQKTT